MGQKHKFEHYAKNHEQAIEFVISRLINPHYGVLKDLSELGGIGHRVVHGGEKFSDPVLITEDVIKEIEKCSDLAPLHNPAAILGIRACQAIVPDMPMVAVFDTAFHQTLEKKNIFIQYHMNIIKIWNKKIWISWNITSICIKQSSRNNRKRYKRFKIVKLPLRSRRKCLCNQRWKISRNKYGINSIRWSTNGHKKWRLRSISSDIYNEKRKI